MSYGYDYGYGYPVADLDKNGDVLIEAETAALISRFTTQPTPERRVLINDLIKALKAAGVWQKLDALYIMAAADAQAARRNWIADAFNLTPVSAPTFTVDRGYQGDGSSSYLSTGYTPSAPTSKWTLNSAAPFIWNLTELAANTVDIGSSAPGGQVQSRRAAGEADTEINNGSTGALRTPVAGAVGLTVGSRTASNLTTLYRNQTVVSTATTISVAVPNQPMFVCGNGTGNYSAKQAAVAGFGGGLSAQNVADLYAALNTYLTAVGAA